MAQITNPYLERIHQFVSDLIPITSNRVAVPNTTISDLCRGQHVVCGDIASMMSSAHTAPHLLKIQISGTHKRRKDREGF